MDQCSGKDARHFPTLLPDTDGDGYPDGLEFESGSTPTNPDSLPSISLALLSGNSQTIPVQSVTPEPLTVAARRQNNPAPRTPITFTLTSPTGGHLSTSPTGPWQAAVTIFSSSSGNSQVYWKAPATPGFSTILATLPGTPTQPPVTFTLNAIDPPPNPSPPGSAPGTTPSNNPPPPPDGVYIFTSERYITGSFNGRSGGEEVILETESDTMQTGEQWYVSTPIPRPPRQSNDGFNGDADAAENLTDPLDPRDENLANAPVPPIQYLRTPAEPDTPGAQMINETYEVTRYTGNYSVTQVQPVGNYRAHNDITAIPPATQNQTNSGTLQSTTLTNMMRGMPWMQGSNPQHGWRGNGKLGVQARSAHVSWEKGTHTITYSDPDGAGPGRTSTIHYQTASARHTQVRLQSSKPVIAEAGASRNFILIKTTTTLPDSPNGPTPQVQTLGTITLKIPKNGTLSTTATRSSESLDTFIKNQDNMAYIELRPTEFTLNQKISLSLLPAEVNVNDTADAKDDIVRKEQKIGTTAWRQWIPCTVKIPNATSAQITSIGVTAESGTMKFSDAQAKPGNTDAGAANVNVTLDAQGQGKFWITGITQSANKDGAKLQIRKNGATGDVLVTKSMTVFWFESTITFPDVYQTRAVKFSDFYGIHPSYPWGFEGEATITPPGLDSTAPQIANMRLGFVQNIQTSRKWHVNNPAVQPGSDAPSSSTVTVASTRVGTVVWQGYVLDTTQMALWSPFYRSVSSFSPSARASINNDDSPSSYADVNIKPAQAVQGNQTWPVNVKYQWDKTVIRDDFLLWLGIAEAGSDGLLQNPPSIVPIRQVDWRLHADSSVNGLQTPSSGTHKVPDIVPVVTGPTANLQGESRASYQWQDGNQSINLRP